VRVERTDGRAFPSYEAAAAHARAMTIGGEYTHAPMRLDRAP
jgi:hypothetical protein